MRSPVLGVLVLTGLLAAASPLGAQTKDSEIGGKTLAQWVAELKDLDPGVKLPAIQAIAQFGPNAQESAATPLIALLAHTDTSVRVNAAITLGAIGLPDKELDKGVNGLVGLLKDTQAVARFQAAVALGRIGPAAKSALSYMGKFTIHDKASWEIRKAAAYSLGSIGADPKLGPDPNAMNALMNGLRDPCGQVRLASVASLSVLGPAAKPADMQPIINALKGVLRDRDRSVIIGARLALLRMDKNAADEAAHLKAFAALLKDPDLQARSYAAEALGTLGPRAKSHIPQLIANLWDKQPQAAASAGSALTQLKDQLSQKDLDAIAQLLQSTDSGMRSRGAHVIGALGATAKSEVPNLIATLKDREPAVLQMTVWALGQMGKSAPQAVEPLRQLAATHPDDNVKKMAEAAAKKILGIDK